MFQVSVKHNNICFYFYCYLDNIFRSVDHNQVNFTKQIRSSVQNNFYDDDFTYDGQMTEMCYRGKNKIKTYIVKFD
jgi:hypothetical protein